MSITSLPFAREAFRFMGVYSIPAGTHSYDVGFFFSSMVFSPTFFFEAWPDIVLNKHKHKPIYIYLLYL